MPKYTLMHGGLTMKVKDDDGKLVSKHFPHGSEVDISVEEAAKLNRRALHVKLSAHIKAEADAEAKKQEILAKLTAKVDADLKAELEAEKKKAGGAK